MPGASAPFSARDLPTIVPGALALGLFLVWAALDGGYAPARWLLGAMFLVVLLAVSILSAVVGTLSRPVWVSIVLLGAFTAWSGLSIAWADAKGDAWDGANRTFLYLIVYVLFVTRPWRPAVAAWALGAFVLGVTVLGGVDFLRAVHAGAPRPFFIAGRLATPIAYPNATTGLFLMSAWAGLYFASRREVPVLVRGLMLASTGVLVELALLGQSRGSLFAVPLVGALYLAAVPGRARAILALVPVSLAAWASSNTLLDVYRAVTEGNGVASALVAARRDMFWTAIALFGVGALLGLLDRRVRLSPHVARAGRLIVGGVAVVGIAAGIVAIVMAVGNPIARAGDGWRQFRSNANTPQTKLHIVSGLGSKRYDAWRVAVHEFAKSPLTGIGADNFAIPYLRERKTAEMPLYPHSLELRLLSQTGLVGTLLFVGFLVFALAGAWRSMRRGSGFARGVAGVAALTFAYWLVHGSVDWFWEMPALAAPAFAFLAVAVRTTGGPPDTSTSGEAVSRRSRWVAPIVAALVLPALATFAFPWLAAREVDAAAASWRADPQKAFDRLKLARELNPLSDKPDILAGVIAGRLGESVRQRADFERALERNPKNWYPQLWLGIIESRAGRRDAARAALREAIRLNPTDPVVLEVSHQVEAGKRVDPAQIERLFAERLEFLTGRRQR